MEIETRNDAVLIQSALAQNTTSTYNALLRLVILEMQANITLWLVLVC
jgi:hypothetical protein